MLDKYLENKIKSKLRLYHTLQASDTIETKELCRMLRTNESALRALIRALQDDFQGLAEIERKRFRLSLRIYDNVNTLQLQHAIYRDSIVLQCLKFLITNENRVPYSQFSNTFFLSTSSAYRIRNICHDYLRSIGLDINSNKIVGEEYRIRFLIALLNHKYGIPFSEIDDRSVTLARSFVLSTNQIINADFLDSTANEYGFFERLLILSWQRQQYAPFFKMPRELTNLQQCPIYENMKEYLQKKLEPSLGMAFSEMDYNYIYLIYCCTSSCVLSQQWVEYGIDLIYQHIFSLTSFSDLLQRLEIKFGKNAVQSRAMHIALVNFYKKLILGLQCIMPDTHLYLESRNNPLTLQLIDQMTELLGTWKKDNGIQYPLGSDHIRYLSVQIECIVRQFMKPVQVVVVSDLIAELEIMKLVFDRKFPPQRVSLTEHLLTAYSTDFLRSLKDSVIIVKHSFIKTLERMELSVYNTIVPVTVEFNPYDINAIYLAIKHYEDKFFLNNMMDSCNAEPATN